MKTSSFAYVQVRIHDLGEKNVRFFVRKPEFDLSWRKIYFTKLFHFESLALGVKKV